MSIIGVLLLYILENTIDFDYYTFDNHEVLLYPLILILVNVLMYFYDK